MTIKEWEIHWAFVKFEDSDEVKRRPVLIINKSRAAIVSLKMTGTDRGDDVRECRIDEWREARIVNEIQELLADEIKAQLSKGACTRKIAQLVESLAKLK